MRTSSTGTVWRKASRSNESGDACIEVAANGDMVAIRDSRDTAGPKIVVSRGDFRGLAEALKKS
ncbi:MULTISPECIES: DUF397 domain-containing protein [Actinomadura]|uniref:DUF397 domain-containing protein n=1 Tax=Actinomadura geliboluensis TaxID=882440 RepID=A0A5S4H3V6_9ACTN|nr:DUF397 domain-containing protein [Actinomadura geliboluensis]TMR39938.1 DUF397 domain-containing protein [Actinomadura geliboluensis]